MGIRPPLKKPPTYQVIAHLAFVHGSKVPSCTKGHRSAGTWIQSIHIQIAKPIIPKTIPRNIPDTTSAKNASSASIRLTSANTQHALNRVPHRPEAGTLSPEASRLSQCGRTEVLPEPPWSGGGSKLAVGLTGLVIDFEGLANLVILLVHRKIGRTREFSMARWIQGHGKR